MNIILNEINFHDLDPKKNDKHLLGELVEPPNYPQPPKFWIQKKKIDKKMYVYEEVNSIK